MGNPTDRATDHAPNIRKPTVWKESEVHRPIEVPLVIQGSTVPPFSLSILHMIPWNSANGEMDEG